MKINLKLLFTSIGFLYLIFVDVGSAQAITSLENFDIQISGNGHTTSNVIEIRVRHRWNSTDSWKCFPDIPADNPYTSALLFANNTARSTNNPNDYIRLADGQCVDNTSIIQWDLSSYGGNSLYGSKTINFLVIDHGLSTGNWTPRTIMYDKPAEVISTPAATTPAPALSSQTNSTAVTGTKNTTPKNIASNSPTSQITDQPTTITEDVDNKTIQNSNQADKPTDGLVKGTEGKQSTNIWYYLLASGLVVAIGLGSYFLGKKRAK